MLTWSLPVAYGLSELMFGHHVRTGTRYMGLISLLAFHVPLGFAVLDMVGWFTVVEH